MNRLNFIEAVLEIGKRKDLHLCDDENELNGLHPGICVYKDSEDIPFIGKLRWPKPGIQAEVDEFLEKELLEGIERRQKRRG